MDDDLISAGSCRRALKPKRRYIPHTTHCGAFFCFVGNTHARTHMNAHAAHPQVFNESNAAGRIANLGIETFGALKAEIAEELNKNADLIVDKARDIEVGTLTHKFAYHIVHALN